MVLLNVWQQVGYFTVLAVAGLTQIPGTVYEAAAIDGATPPQRFFAITLPLLRRTLLFSAVIAIINAVQVFEPVALITQGGPVGATNVLTYHIRRVGIERSQGGLGSAMAVTLMLALIVMIVALFAFWRQRRADERRRKNLRIVSAEAECRRLAGADRDDAGLRGGGFSARLDGAHQPQDPGRNHADTRRSGCRQRPTSTPTAKWQA